MTLTDGSCTAALVARARLWRKVVNNMKDKETYDALENICEDLRKAADDMVNLASGLNAYGYEPFEKSAIEIAGEIETLAHDVFQESLHDNA